MHRRLRLFALPIVLAAVLAAPLAIARSGNGATVTGTVAHAKGYTLIVLGRTRIVSVIRLKRSGHFSVKASRGDTLQLLRPDNTFFGPIVIAHGGRRAYEALGGGSLTLGTIRLRHGYAAPSKHFALQSVDRQVFARADRSGKPVGAGNLGLLVHHHLVKARIASQITAMIANGGGGGGSGSGTLPPGGDPTHVGIVTAFNADVTGAGVPNDENPASAQASGDGLFTEMFMPLALSVNTDAAGVTPAEVSRIVRQDLRLDFYLDAHQAGGAPVSGVNVDCGSLPYCAAGSGPATVAQSNNTSVPSGGRWNGEVPSNPGRPGIFSIQIAPNVGTDQIHPGDVFLVHYHTPGGDVVTPTTLTTYFETVPAVASYNAGSGTQSISYPAAQGARGTDGNPIMMSSGQLTLSLYKPQRASLPGEPGSFFDIGHLHYGVPLRSQNGQRELGCPAQFYSGLSPTLEVSQSSSDPFYNQLFPLHDTADDAPASASNQLGFTLDLAGCMAAEGVPTNAPVDLPITAVDEARQGGTDRASQTIAVCLPGCNPALGTGSPGGVADLRRGARVSAR